MPTLLTEAQLRQIEQALLGRVNLAPRSITEDKLAVGAASAAIVRAGSISDIHIGNLSVDVLTGGTISGETIIIASGGTIQSANYDPNVAGWAIFADGSAEFQNVTVRGVLNAQAGSSVSGDYLTDGATGADLDLTGDLTVGGSITLDATPGVFRTDVTGNRRVEIDGSVRNLIKFVSDVSGGENRYGRIEVTAYSTTGQDQLILGPPYRSFLGQNNYISLIGGGPSSERPAQDYNVQGDMTWTAWPYTSPGAGTMYLGEDGWWARTWHDSQVSRLALELGVLRLYASTALGAGEGTNLQFMDAAATPARIGYLGFATNDDMRVWAEHTGGNILFGTQGTSRGSIGAAGAWTFGSSGTPVGITHAFYNDRPSNPNLLVINRAPVGGSNNAHGIDIYLGASGSPAINTDTGDAYMRFRRPDGTVLGQIRGNGGGTDFVTTSDRKLKDEISSDLAEGAAAFDEIPWRTWRWKSKGTFGAGVVAQQLIKVPRWAHLVHKGGVRHDTDENGKRRKFYDQWGVDYVPLIGAIGAKLADVDRRLRALEDR